MKIKFSFFIIFCFGLIGCIKHNQPTDVKQKRHEYALSRVLDSCMKTQPNFNNNEITRTILADTIKSVFQRNRGFALSNIEDLPFQYEMALEYPRLFDSFESEIDKDAGKYVVKFCFGTSNCDFSDRYDVCFNVFTIMEKDKVAMLVEDSLYYIRGKFRDFANDSQETGFILPSGKCLIDYPTIYISALGNKPVINLGTLILDSLTFNRKEDEKAHQSKGN